LAKSGELCIFCRRRCDTKVGASPCKLCQRICQRRTFYYEKNEDQTLRTDQLAPGETAEVAEELAPADAYRFQVRLNRQQQKTLDPNSYLDYKWEDGKLKITNITGSPVFVSIEEAE